MRDDFVLAVKLANEEISRKLRDDFDENFFDIGEEGAGGDLSSGMDLYAESVFVKYLGAYGRIESEESGIIGEGDATVIIDPIDGSSNALSLFPYYGTSVALVNAEGELEAAIVCNLANGDIFVKKGNAEVRQGRLFAEEFHSRRIARAPEAGVFEKAYAHPEIVARMGELGIKFRAPGAIALSLAYAYSLSYVLFVGRYRIYDFAAGLALCEGLHVLVEDEYVIVTKEKSILEKLDKIVKESIDIEGDGR